MAMVIRDVCPRGLSPTYKKTDHIYNGKQNHEDVSAVQPPGLPWAST